MSAAVDPTTFSSAKFAVLVAVGRDKELPKLSLRVANVIVGEYMCADNGGEAWPAIKRLAGDLGTASERAVREALYALLERGHLIAERKPGETTRYRIAERYFKAGHKPSAGGTPAQDEPTPQAHHEPGLTDTQAHHEPGTQAEIEPPPQAQHEPGTQAHHEPTNSGKGTLGNELCELNSGKDSPPFPLKHENPVAFALFETPPNPSPGRKRERSREAGRAFEEEFSEWWANYPQKVGKLAAEKAYRTARKQASAPELLNGLMRYTASPPRFWMHPKTWLNGGHWADEPAPSPARGEPSMSAMMGQILERETQRRAGAKTTRPTFLEVAMMGIGSD
jgi:hypothetical protein